MFNKTSFLDNLNTALKQGLVSVIEVKNVIAIYDKSSITVPNDKSKTNPNTLFRVFIFSGVFIVLLGIFFLISLVWSELGNWGQIAITLGLGIILNISGSIFYANLKEKSIGLLTHTFGAVLIPPGFFLLLFLLENQFNLSSGGNIINVILIFFFLLLTLIYGLTDHYLKNGLFTFLTIIFYSLSYFISVFWIDWILDELYPLYFKLETIFLLFYILYSLPLIIFGRLIVGFRQKIYRFSEGIGYIILFWSFFALVLETPWEITAGLLYVLAIVIAGLQKIYSLLIFSFIALTCYILYVNVVYFAELISWPIALIISGLILIASGYLFSRIHSKLTKQD